MTNASTSTADQVRRAVADMRSFTLHDLKSAGLHNRVARTTLADMLAAGEIETVVDERSGAYRYRIVEDPQAHRIAIREESPYRNMWGAMRGLRTFGVLDVVAHACSDKVTVTEAQVSRYARQLVDAGYLRVMVKAVPGKKPATYQLVRNTGPRPPQPQKVLAILDDNLGRLTWMETPDGPWRAP